MKRAICILSTLLFISISLSLNAQIRLGAIGGLNVSKYTVSTGEEISDKRLWVSAVW